MQFNDYRTLGFTVISNGLIAYYSQLDISDPELIVIIQLEAFFQKREYFPANEKIAANTNLNETEVAAIIQQLINKNFLSIEQSYDSNNRISNNYSLKELYNHLDKFLSNNIVRQKENDKQSQNTSHSSIENDPLNSISRQFEIEFGRYLSPIERQEIAAWLNMDHYSPEIIKLALREAVLSQVYNLKYVDRILLNWQRHNLTTPEQIKRFLQRNQ